MSIQQKICLGYAFVLFVAASLNYVPGLTDTDGRAFGIFALDLFDDALHVASGLWALAAALISRRAARHFLTWFGLLYFSDGLLGLLTGSGYLDFGIFLYGALDLPLGFRVLANLPHLALGGFAIGRDAPDRAEPDMTRGLKRGMSRSMSGRVRPGRRLALRLLAWIVLPVVALAFVLAAPVAYVETLCRGDSSRGAVGTTPIVELAERRPEARTYLTYPEWHIVYAYDGLAEAVAHGGAHRFDYLPSIAGFWTSLCSLSARADAHGSPGFPAKATAYTIGLSFSLELALKGLYEESVGRLVAWIGGTGTAQDDVERAVAADYAAFLRQTPWYRYDFDAATDRLWAGPASSLRGWERRLALGAEWKAKAAYAGLIAGAAGAVGADSLTIRSVVTGLPPATLASPPGVVVIESVPEGVVIETPRYQEYTEILARLAALGGDFREIAGNDNIMLSVIAGPSESGTPDDAVVVARVRRPGFSGDRLLLDTRVTALAEVLRSLPAAGLELEHVYDY